MGGGMELGPVDCEASHPALLLFALMVGHRVRSTYMKVTYSVNASALSAEMACHDVAAWALCTLCGCWLCWCEKNSFQVSVADMLL